MRLRYPTKQFFNSLRGDVPTTVILWYVVLSVMSIATLIGILFWYTSFYSIVYGSGAAGSDPQLYKKMINAQKLKDVLEYYDVK